MGKKLLISRNTRFLTTNLPLLEKLCWKKISDWLLLVMFQESYQAGAKFEASWITWCKTQIISITAKYNRNPNKGIGCMNRFMQKAVDFSWQNQRGRILDHKELGWWTKKNSRRAQVRGRQWRSRVWRWEDNNTNVQVQEWLFLYVCFIGLIA